ncbi:hypothetical protein LAZ67_9001834 [Cordylochernes scorpioides]|uniref:Transposase n=1 Tax=Cordylochernes scorpioides TaxID=51811 RepID=A0ABY6KW37_9ARAC|nr:hypothetical protein LAZ67_9001834 [Cordylochernes scorpioides]
MLKLLKRYRRIDRCSTSVSTNEDFATENPTIFKEIPLHQPRVTVWCGFTYSLIGPFSLNKSTEELLKPFLEKVIPISQDRQALTEITFMQDVGPPHISRGAKQLLKDTFVASKITRLDALRFLVMGYIKSHTARDNIGTIKALRDTSKENTINVRHVNFSIYAIEFSRDNRFQHQSLMLVVNMVTVRYIALMLRHSNGNCSTRLTHISGRAKLTGDGVDSASREKGVRSNDEDIQERDGPLFLQLYGERNVRMIRVGCGRQRKRFLEGTGQLVSNGALVRVTVVLNGGFNATYDFLTVWFDRETELETLFQERVFGWIERLVREVNYTGGSLRLIATEGGWEAILSCPKSDFPLMLTLDRMLLELDISSSFYYKVGEINCRDTLRNQEK